MLGFGASISVRVLSFGFSRSYDVGFERLEYCGHRAADDLTEVGGIASFSFGSR